MSNIEFIIPNISDDSVIKQNLNLHLHKVAKVDGVNISFYLDFVEGQSETENLRIIKGEGTIEHDGQKRIEFYDLVGVASWHRVNNDRVFVAIFVMGWANPYLAAVIMSLKKYGLEIQPIKEPEIDENILRLFFPGVPDGRIVNYMKVYQSRVIEKKTQEETAVLINTSKSQAQRLEKDLKKAGLM